MSFYLLVELVPPLTMGLFVFAALLMLIAVKDFMDILFLGGAGVWTVTKIVLSFFPLMLTMSLPIGSLLAAMLVYGRLSEDREITAMRAAGMSTLSLAIPPMILGAVLTVFNLYWTSYVSPKSLQLLNQARWEIVEQMTSINWIKPGQFNAPQDDLAFYFTGAAPGTNSLQRITFFKSGAAGGPLWFGDEATEQSAANWTVSAPTATLIPKPKEGILQLHLQSCMVEDLRPERVSRVEIESATLSIDMGQRLEKLTQRGFSRRQESRERFLARADERLRHYREWIRPLGFDEETPHAEVLERVERLLEEAGSGKSTSPIPVYELEFVKDDLRDVQRYRNMAMLRLAYPVGTFFFMMVGIPLGLLTGRGKRTLCLMITSGVLLVYYSLQEIAETVSESIALSRFFEPGLLVWTPNLLLGLTAAALLRSASKN